MGLAEVLEPSEKMEGKQLETGIKHILRSLTPDNISGHHIWSGPLRGNTIFTSWKRYPRAIIGINDPALISWLSRNVKRGETWLDIGAYVGYMSLAMSRAAERVFSFEASPLTFGLLARTCAANRQHFVPIPVGLGPDPGLSIRVIGTTDSGMVDHSADYSKETVLLASFDWLWPQINAGKPEISGVKIDVEGNEIFVLRGMTQGLAKWHPKLVIELHSGVSRQELGGVLESSGYDSTPIRLSGEAISLNETEENGTYEFRAKRRE